MTQQVFTASGTFTPPAGVSSVDVLVVGGGGGGGRGGGSSGGAGGGGAGGVRWVTGIAVTPGTPVTVTVGGGGNGAASNGTAGGTGGPSSFGATAAEGGGGGGGGTTAGNRHGRNGGSGGGGGGTFSNQGSGGTGTAGQGTNGGGGGNPTNQGGGGGGAGAAGSSASTSKGGNGVNMSANVGTSVGVAGWFGGGGAGDGGSNPAGGTGGGGNGENYPGFGTPGTPNTGGGGGGNYSGTAYGGGSGVVIVVYTAGATPTTISGGQATSTATALAGLVVAGAVLAGGIATETDAALDGVARRGQIELGGTAQETDAALPGNIAVGFTLPGGQAAESDDALTGSFAGFTALAGGQALEVDTALGGSISLGYAAADTANRADGRSRGGYAVATWEPPVAAAPPAIVRGYAEDVAQAFGDVTMNGTQPGYDVETVAKRRHRNRILVGGKDITYFRGVETPLPAYQLVSPLLYGPATLRLPQVAAAFERPGHGSLSWLDTEKVVKIQRVDADTGDVVATDYKGVVLALNHAGADLTVEIGGEASGRAALVEKQLYPFRDTRDIGRLAFRAIQGLGLPFSPRLGPTTGIRIARFGGTGMLDYLSQIVARAWTRSGNQWTIMPGDDGSYRMFRKDTTTIAATAYCDDARVVADLRCDLAEEPNRIFVTGVAPSGQRVTFAVFPGLVQGKAAPYPFHNDRHFSAGTTNEETDTGDGVAVMLSRLRATGYLSAEDAVGGYDADATQAIRHLQEEADGVPVTGTMTPATWRALFDLDQTGYSLEWARVLPAAQKSYTRPWDLSASGARVRRNPGYRPNRLPRDRNIDVGSGFTVRQMRELARAELAASSEDNWYGTITFHQGGLVEGDHTPGDPIGPSDLFRARRLRPGMNLKLPQFDGGIVVHVSGISVGEDGKVTAQVDTRARDSMNVAEVITRNRESRANLARQWVRQHRASGMTKDAIDGWFKEGGVLGNDIEIPGKKWTVFPVVAGQEGTVGRLLLNTAPHAEFVCAVFGRPIPEKRLERLVGAPLSKKGTRRWEDEGVRRQLDDHILLYAAGSNEQPCGYFPRQKRPDTIIVDEANPDYDPSADENELGTDDEPTIEVEHESGSITPLTGKWKDDAGFAYRTFRDPVLYVAVYADRHTTIPSGRVMWPVFEAGA